jgi:hypothetical protein
MSDVNVEQAQKALDIATSISKSTSAKKQGKADQAGSSSSSLHLAACYSDYHVLT